MSGRERYMYSVLIADDEVNIVEGLCSTIQWQEHGCRVVATAYNGQEALKLAVEHKPDIIITDITMPKLDGLQLVEEVLKTLSYTSFIVLTCHEDFSLARNALRLGVCDYILKETMTRQELYDSLEKAKQTCKEQQELGERAVAEEDPEIRRMVEYIHKHIAEHLTLDDLAEVMSMNPSYFSRFFKNKMGENFVDYLTRVRIQFAMEQLRLTSHSIDVIAEQAGYLNQSYFNAVFKKMNGITPSKYRKEQRERHSLYE